MLCAHRVRFLIVGAHALGVIGRIRATKALDLLVEPTRANAKRLCAALADFGFEALAETSITGVTFSRAWRGRVKARLGGHEIGVLGREEFLQNKRAAARPQDLADVAMVEEIERVSNR